MAGVRKGKREASHQYFLQFVLFQVVTVFMKLRGLFCFLIFVIALDGCVDPFTFNSQNEEIIVVEGMITDQHGPYTVRLSYGNNLNDPLREVHAVNGAKVEIFDHEGPSEKLREKSPGTFQTDSTGIQGIVGHAYFLRVTLADGTVVESAAEKLRPVGEIKRVYYEFKQVVEGYSDDNGFNIYVDAEVLPEQNGLVRWRTEGTWKVETYPWLKLRYDSMLAGVIIPIPDPPVCSGYVWAVPRRRPPGIATLYKVDECKCCTCWVTDYDKNPIVSNEMFDTKAATHQFLTFIPASRRLFSNKYHLRVDQMSLSQSVYDFWKSVQKQRASSSDLFQTPSVKTTGNVNVRNGNIHVVGYFAASSTRTFSFFLDRRDIPYSMPAIDTIAESCLINFKNSTTKQPAFW
jgi:hypothetical protein